MKFFLLLMLILTYLYVSIAYEEIIMHRQEIQQHEKDHKVNG